MERSGTGGHGRDVVTIVTAPSQLPAESAVWGGGDRSLSPTRREALDWLTLCRFVGWHPGITPSVPATTTSPPRCLVLALEPTHVDEEAAAALATLLEREPMLVVARAAPAGTPLASIAGVAAEGERRVTGGVRWTGPGPSRSWLAWLDLELASVRAHPDATPWALVGDAPLMVGHRVGRGHVVTVAAHPSRLRDAAPPGTGVLRHLLLWGTPPPVAWIDFEDTLVLRLDDPGSAASSHLSSWRHPTVREAKWAQVAAQLRARGARMSVGYVPGWVDDGDPSRGTLRVAGHRVERVPGGIHPSPLVRYEEHPRLGGGTHDHESEYRGLRWLAASGVGDLELHGFTHIRDIDRWATAGDRYDGVHWYRELEELTGAHATVAGDYLVRRGQQVLGAYFGTRPVALLCPGQTCSEPAGVAALGAGLDLVAGECLGVRHAGRLCWSPHVLSPYLDGPHRCWFEAGLPVVGCLHDRDVALRRPGWFPETLDQWRDAGARRLVDFRVVAGMLARRVVLAADDRPTLERANGAAPPLVKPVPVRVRTARGAVALWALQDPGSGHFADEARPRSGRGARDPHARARAALGSTAFTWRG